MIAALLLLCVQTPAPVLSGPELLVAHPGLFEGRYSEVREEQLAALEAEPNAAWSYAATRSIVLLEDYCPDGIAPARLEELAGRVTDGRTQFAIKLLLQGEIIRRRFSESPYPAVHDLHADFLDNWFALGPYGQLNEPSPLWGDDDAEAPHHVLRAEYQANSGATLSWRPLTRERNDVGVLPDSELYPAAGGTAFLLASIEANVSEALLEIISPRPLQVFWNGELVHEELRVGLTHSDARMTVPVQVAPGPNRLLLRFENGASSSLGARLLQLDGQLLQNSATSSTSLETALRPHSVTDSVSVQAPNVPAADTPFSSCVEMLLALSNNRADAALAIPEPTSAGEVPAWLRLRHLAIRSADHLPAEVHRRFQLNVEDHLERLDVHIPEIIAERALRLMDEDQVGDALTLAEELLAAHPRVPAFHWIRNDALGALDASGVMSNQGARSTLEVIDDSVAWELLADEALARSDVAGAIEHLTRAAAVDGSASRLLGLLAKGDATDHQVADKILQRLKADNPGSSWYENFELGMLAQRKELAAIEAALDKDVAERPDKPANWQLLASFHLRHGDNAKARVALERALAVDPSDLWSRRALEQLGTQNDSEAFFSEFAPNRDAALAAGETAEGASTALVLDSRLVFVREDGSLHSRTHQITLALDRTGTEMLQEQSSMGETIVAKVLGADGVTFEPVLVNGSWVMPSLDPGDAVEMVFDEFAAASHGSAPNLSMWTFESFEQPFLVSRYAVYLPPGLAGEWNADSFTGDHQEIPWKNGTVHIFEMRDRPRLEPEAAAPSQRELLSWVSYGEDDKVNFLAQALSSNLAWQKDVAADVRLELEAFVSQVAAEHSAEEMPHALYDAVTEHVIEFAGSGDTTDVWYLQRGNPMGLLAALFDIAEVEYEWCMPYPSGPPELDADPKRPFLTGNVLGSPWFRITNPSGEVTWLFIPGGGRGYTFGRVPAGLAGSRLLVLGDDGPRFETVAEARDDDWMSELEIDIYMQADKTARVSIHYLMSDVSGPLTREIVSQLEPQQRDQGLRQMAGGLVRGIDITDWDVKEMSVRGNDLELTIEGTMKSFVRGSKTKPYCKLPWPKHGLSRAAGEGDRTWPFALRIHRADKSVVRIHASDAWQFGTPPESKLVEREGIHYEIRFEPEADMLTVQKDFRIHGLFLTADELAAFARELKDLEDLDTARIPLSATE